MTDYQRDAAAQLKALGPPRHKPKNRPCTPEEIEERMLRRMYHNILNPGRYQSREWLAELRRRRKPRPSQACKVSMPKPLHKRKPQRKRTAEQVLNHMQKWGKWKLLVTEPQPDGDVRYTVETTRGVMYVWKSEYEDVPQLS